MSENVYWTPPRLAKLWGIKPERVLKMIRRGSLRAFDVAEPGSRRPRFRIPPDAVVEFEQRHAGAVAPPPPRRRKTEGNFIRFFS